MVTEKRKWPSAPGPARWKPALAECTGSCVFREPVRLRSGGRGGAEPPAVGRRHTTTILAPFSFYDSPFNLQNLSVS